MLVVSITRLDVKCEQTVLRVSGTRLDTICGSAGSTIGSAVGSTMGSVMGSDSDISMGSFIGKDELTFVFELI